MKQGRSNEAGQQKINHKGQRLLWLIVVALDGNRPTATKSIGSANNDFRFST